MNSAEAPLPGAWAGSVGFEGGDAMQVAVSFGDEWLALEVPDDRLVARWEGPAGSPSADVERLVAEALEHPHDYPPLRQAVVPGDRVVIAFDAEVPQPRAVLEAVCGTLRGV